MRYCLSLFLTLLFISSGLFAAGSADWKKAFSSPKVGMYKGFGCEIYYFEKCVVPGRDRSNVVAEYFRSERERDAIESRIKTAKNNIAHYEEKAEEKRKELELLDEDSEEKEEMEEDLKALLSMTEKSQKELEEAEADKKQFAESEKKKSAAADPKKPETREVFTTNYYNFAALSRASSRAHTVASKLANGMHIIPTVRVYVVTNPKMWNALKCETKDIWPVRNTCVDKKTRSILLFASPPLTNVLVKTLTYAAASIYCDEAMLVANKDGELCDTVAKGLLAEVSGLREVVEVNKVFSLPKLNEKDLLLPSEMLNPTKMQDPKRCLCFIRQSWALVQFLERNGNLRKYAENAKGNSSFRHDYEFFGIRADWAKNYDDFLNGLTKRVFFPLTEASTSEAGAMAQWKSELDKEDSETRYRKQRVRERAEDRHR